MIGQDRDPTLLAAACDHAPALLDNLRWWLTELADPAFPSFRAAFTGILTTARR